MSRSSDGSRDEGVSTIFAALCLGLLLVMAGLGIRLGGAMLARERAENAADLGALAGAAAMLRGADVACAAAARVVQANAATLTSCQAKGFDLLVQAEVQSWGGSAQGRARAGPVSAG